eukprot:CAMPEP_0184699976 /NCGR_PEP_ID=MMETSP0313-20130426/6917_1 /TAXON_ID=2792 /ORGANISM="Porphyridium aerugineum, Strain SAG 1380-2" /LENGTH=44 /DNA_ID= /DNA_START= /DNA_END= /DNA_ORIENTATION=
MIYDTKGDYFQSFLVGQQGKAAGKSGESRERKAVIKNGPREFIE